MMAIESGVYCEEFITKLREGGVAAYRFGTYNIGVISRINEKGYYVRTSRYRHFVHWDHLMTSWKIGFMKRKVTFFYGDLGRAYAESVE